MKRLEGKTALVTGSTRGLGRTTAEWLANEGCAIVVTGREAEAVKASVDAVKAYGVEAIGIPADLSVYQDAHRLAGEAIAAAGRIDILVNNAGMSIRKHFWDFSDDDWDYQVNVNVRSPFILAQQLAKHFIREEIRGRIVNISTIGAHKAHRDGAIYNLAKGGVEVMTRNMSFELAPYGITVNCVAPGAIADKPGTPVRPAHAEYASKFIPFGRVGKAADIAAAVLFFCLPESEFTTGQTLLIDGAHASYYPGQDLPIARRQS